MSNTSGIASEYKATEAGGGDYVDVTSLFCTNSQCPVIIGNTLVYFDWAHMTFEFSREMAAVTGALVDRALEGQ